MGALGDTRVREGGPGWALAALTLTWKTPGSVCAFFCRLLIWGGRVSGDDDVHDPTARLHRLRPTQPAVYTSAAASAEEDGSAKGQNQ